MKFQLDVVVVQRPRRNIQKSVMHVLSYCFVNIILSISCRSRFLRRRRLLQELLVLQSSLQDYNLSVSAKG